MMPGEKIKFIRKYRKLSQQELGEAIGFPSSSAAIRISQYESNARHPKEDICIKISKILKCNYKIFYNKTMSYESLVLTLMLFEEIEEGNLIEERVNRFIKQWKDLKVLLENGKIKKDEYIEWKINYLP